MGTQPIACLATKNIAKDLRNVPVREKLLSKVYDNPCTGKQLKGNLQRLQSVRNGSYRLVYLLQEQEGVCLLAAADNRDVVYKKTERRLHTILGTAKTVKNLKLRVM